MRDSADQSRVQFWGSLWKIARKVIKVGSKAASSGSSGCNSRLEEGDDAEVNDFLEALEECEKQCTAQ